MRAIDRARRGRGIQQLIPLVAKIKAMFANGEQGAWYDPSDYSTLFQDSAGTKPVTAVEQPVGLMLDKSQGLVLGPELVTNGDFSDGTTGWINWLGKGTSFTASGGVARLDFNVSDAGIQQNIVFSKAGTFKVELDFTCQYTGQGSVSAFFLSGFFPGGTGDVAISFGQTRRLAFYATKTSAGTSGLLIRTAGAAVPANGYFLVDNVTVKELPGNHAFQSTSASRPVLSARVNKLLATATLATQSVTTRATAHTLRFEGAGTVTLTGTAIGVYTAGTHSITTTAGTLTLTVVGSVTSADLRETNDGVGLPVYQAVVTSTNYATTGFLPFLRFDGVDDSLSTNSINFTSTDKMSVFAGVRKLIDTGIGMVAELSANNDSNNGSFAFAAPVNSSTYYAALRGTALSARQPVTPIPAPTTSVVGIAYALSQTVADEITMRVNGGQIATNTASGKVGPAGTGNFGNYPLYIGRRGNESLPFNGQLYSMIIVGKAVQAGELSSAEKYVNSKTKAFT